MGSPFDPVYETDDWIATLLDTIEDLDGDDDQYLPTEAELEHAKRLAVREFDRAAGREQNAPAEPDAMTVIAETVVDEIESWLAEVASDEVRARGPRSAPTVERTMPELADLGYAPEVEIDADIDCDTGTSDISVQLTAIAAKPAGLLVRVIDKAGVAHTAQVNRYGLAIIRNAALGAFHLLWERRV
ncbi:hypothetical protein [Nocardia nepalensis]|uniref:hypothetical protein n=1 Tax=Nocardia nepalensis TaxID=3375448 RepID=UPI003B66DE18